MHFAEHSGNNRNNMSLEETNTLEGNKNTKANLSQQKLSA